MVIIRLRDRYEVGSTFIRIIERYTQTLKAQGNLLMLSGLNRHVLEQLEDTNLLDSISGENVFPAQARFGASIEQARQRAETWKNQRS